MQLQYASLDWNSGIRTNAQPGPGRISSLRGVILARERRRIFLTACAEASMPKSPSA